MKKNTRYVSFGNFEIPLKCLLWAKFNVILLFFFSIQSFAGINAQDNISLSLQNVRLTKVFKAIEKQVKYRFVYKTETIPDNNVSIEVENASLDAVLQIVLDNTPLTYKMVNDKIVVITSVFTKTVTGRVTDDKGEALIGVSISEQGTSTGTVTNQNGNYSISVAGDNSVLVFQHVGHDTKTETVGARTVVNIILQTQTKEMSEVVVTSLGIRKESRKLGYAASSVKVDEIAENRTTNVMTALEGKIAGLEIAPPTAGAGASNRIRLRGQAGFNGQTNSPLIVINGLPMDQGARSAEGGGPAVDQGDNLQQVNPDDIETMTVLKGATAAALYGSRASNGAIIITTKSGAKNSKFGVEFTSNFAAATALDYSDYQTEYGTGSNGKRPASQAQAQSFGNLAWGEKYDGVPTYQYDGVQRPYSPDLNRTKQFYNTGTSYVNTLALSGGNATTSYRVSFSNQDAKGISPGNSYHKRIFNLGLNSKVTDKLTLQANINYTHEENKNPPLVGAQGIGFSSFLNRIPLTVAISTLKTSVENPDGTIMSTNPFNNLLTNPYYLIGRMFNYTKRDRLLGTVSLRYDFTKWLYLQGRVNADFGYNNNEANNPSNYAPNAPINSSTGGWAGSYGVSTGFNKQMNSDFLLGTTQKIGDFTIDASVGGNMYTVDNNFSGQNVNDFVVRNVYSISNGITKTQSYNISKSQVNSIYAFADFGYKNFLYLNITDRSDYFSVLTPPSSIVANPQNSFNYPSASASFVFSELLPNVKWLNYGKLRMSYAKVGNANGVDPYSSQLTYAIESQLFGGYSVANIAGGGNNPNPYIIPYSVSEKEIGLELRTLHSRLNFDISAYDKRTDDQILPINLSASSGYTGQNVNIAKLKNTGVEVMIDGTPVKTSNFNWNVSVNASYNISKVLALNPGQTRQVVTFFNGTGNEFIGYLTYDVGKEMNQLVDYTYLRNDKGQVMLNSSGNLIHSADFVNYGSANYKWIGGITNTFNYKSLSLLIQVDGKFGGKVFSSTAINGLRSGIGKNSLVDRGGVVFDGVLPNGTQNTISVAPQTFYANYRSQ
ncbi:MAG: SusC/RagA family TonB-linked outer membrane protein, partial [Bacteroidia bacterium]|nr:SusC/RagA family TonB-linked outer membrane protein [Bacteroidia bacterium]